MTDGHGSGLRARVRAFRRRNAAGSDAGGFTLIETLISVVILGMISTTFMGGLILMERGSAMQRASAAADMEMRRYMDWIQSVTYTSCANPASGHYVTGFVASDATVLTSAIDTSQGSGEGILFSQQLSYSGVVADDDLFGTGPKNMTFVPRASSTCPTSDPGAQRIFLKVTYNDGSINVVRTASVVKRYEN
jgi:prepilin-type N-terminal cleavage/methylation domain-containing protein